MRQKRSTANDNDIRRRIDVDIANVERATRSAKRRVKKALAKVREVVRQYGGIPTVN